MIFSITLLLFTIYLTTISADYSKGGGHSNTFRKQDAHGNYAFGYDIVDPIGAKNFRKESGDKWGNKAGSYGLHDVDGRLRIVDYIADEHGFRAKIRTNEPGTANKDSAGVTVNGPDEKGYSDTHIPSGDVKPEFNQPTIGNYQHGISGSYGHQYPNYAHGGKHSQPVEHYQPVVQHYQPIVNHYQPVNYGYGLKHSDSRHYHQSLPYFG